MPPPKIAGGPYVMGVLNVTPDSFSDGGAHESAAAPHALAMLEAGADIIDIGGESTRPGAAPVEEGQEMARVVPVIAALRAATKAPISIDTMKASVAVAALQAGASIWNDVAALQSPGALETAAALRRPVILMHMQGEPRTMQQDPRYDDVVGEVMAFLDERVAALEAAGAVRERFVLDPGFGFGKRTVHNYALLRELERFSAGGLPVLAGMSRKSMLGAVTGREVGERLAASVAAALIAVQRGAAIVRVHDVAPTLDALKVWQATLGIE